ncbi:hypothetical protein [Bacillus sp. 1P06AnD]
MKVAISAGALFAFYVLVETTVSIFLNRAKRKLVKSQSDDKIVGKQE